MPGIIRSLLIFMAVLQFLVVVPFAVGLVVYRKSRMIKASQPLMMWLVLSMGLWGGARTIAGTYPVSTNVCIAHYWTGHLAFTGIVAFFVKDLRVYLLIHSRGPNKFKMSSRNILIFVSVFFVLLLAYMAISTAISPPHPGLRVTTAITGQDMHIYNCKNDTPVLAYILYAFEGLFLLLAVKLSNDTRYLPDAMNETKSIATGITAVLE
jgi:hypothetical protein